MGLFDRMGRVISSNFNSLLDQVENPNKSLKLLVGEMKEQLRAGQRYLVESVAAEKQLKQRVEQIDKDIERWEKRAELAVRVGDDELARQALAQKRSLIAERDKAESLRAEQRAGAFDMKAELERMTGALKGIELRQNTVGIQAQQARSGGGVENLGHQGVGPTPFDELRRFENQVEGVEVAIQAQREVEQALRAAPGRLSMDEVESRFLALEQGKVSADAPSNTHGDEELRAMKKRVRVE